jgi:hypothetical protein
MFNRQQAKARYRVASSLMVYGLVALAAFMPLVIVSWGTAINGYVFAYLASGVVALMAATLLGVFNIYYLHSNPPPPAEARIFE